MRTKTGTTSFESREIVPVNFFDARKSMPRLGEILMQSGAIDKRQLDGALQKQKSAGGRLGEILVSGEAITEMKLAEALSTQLELPLFTLTRYQPMPEAIRAIPRNIAKRLRLVPLSIVEEDMLLVAMADPLDLLAQDEVGIITGRRIRLGVTTSSEIESNLDRLYSLQGNLEDAILEIGSASSTNFFSEAETNNAPVIQLVDNILKQAVREGTSDIHAEPCRQSARIRYRVDGVLYTVFEYPLTLHPAVSSRMKIMAGMDIAEKRAPQDGRTLIRLEGRSVDLRVSSVPTTRGEKIVLRVLDPQNSVVGLERLGLDSDEMEKIEFFCGASWGVLLVTGPTGSGKSTTLYSILEKINQPGVNIMTVEDPVEYSLDGISQIHVNERAGLSFESALRSILRQDPDKIMVGEIRDGQTAQITIRSALTGHFVLSSLHTNDAPGAMTRMIEMGVPPFLVSASLTGVIAQRLVRKLCPYCKQEYRMSLRTCEALEIPVGSRAWKATGCNECRQGYRGRSGIYEIMVMDDDLREMILGGTNNIRLRSAAVKKGMKTLRQSGLSKVLSGITSIEEVMGVTH
ncbi:MAG: GspE/PulE family protein [Synergistaceae bacterium]|nr:GspE/PulE family protein [Synergistaceae bacterium]